VESALRIPVGTGDHLLDGLNHAQVQAVTASGGPVVVLAGAGSGKTRVLTRRIAWRVLRGETDPERVLTLTFTRKAAAELRERQLALGLRDRVPAGTFHSTALAQLRQRWNERGIAPPKLLDRKVRFVGQLLGGSARRRESGRFEATDVAAEIDWARARMVEPDGYGAAARAAGREPPIPADDLAEVMVRYQQEKRRKRLVDFDDLLHLALRDLRADPDYAAAVRWRHRHLYVDEFQDVNPLQHALLGEWLGDRDDLFVVGDPNQAIYGWNGADPDLLVSMAVDGANTVVRLDDNYRSTPQILALAAAALGPASDPAAPPTPAGGGSGSGRPRPMRAHRAAGSLPTLSAHPDDRAEAAAVAGAVRRHKTADRPWADQAILVRTNAQLVLIEEALHQAGIPSRVRSGPGPLGSPEVKTELRNLGRDGIDLVECLEELDERVSALSSGAGPGPTGPAAERAANLTALSALIHEYVVTEERPTGPGLVAWLATLQHGASEGADHADAVDLSTFHGAKGLEWPVVHVAGLEVGFVPIAYATTDAQLAEERRLLYVALTRAEEQLHLSWAAERTFGVSTVGRDPSPYLARLGRALDGLRGSERGPVDWRAGLELTRSRIPEPGPSVAPGDAELLEALRRWRAGKARAAGVAPHVIVDDRTLRLVSEQRPTSRAQLAALPGIRPTRLARLGDDLLAVVARAGGTS
jgi:DNA helicase-2/ATP-dependent DNA helicase PcrA